MAYGKWQPESIALYAKALRHAKISLDNGALVEHATATNGSYKYLVIRRHFMNMSSYVKFVQGPSDQPDDYRHSRTGRQDFTGTQSWDEAIKLATYGWPEGLKAVKRLADDLYTKVGVLIEREKTFHDFSGSYVDVGRYVDGDPENMVEFEPCDALGPGNILKVVVSGSVSCGYTTDQIQRRGAAILALLDAIESTGARTEVILSTCTGSSGHCYESLVTIKKANEPLSLDAIVFAVCHPSMARRLDFSAREMLPYAEAVKVDTYGGYGMPMDALVHGDVHIDGLYGHGDAPYAESDEKAVKWVVDMFNSASKRRREMAETISSHGDDETAISA